MARLIRRRIVVGVEEGRSRYLTRLQHVLVLGAHPADPVLVDSFWRTSAAKRHGMKVKHISDKAPRRVAVLVHALNKNVFFFSCPLVAGWNRRGWRFSCSCSRLGRWYFAPGGSRGYRRHGRAIGFLVCTNRDFNFRSWVLAPLVPDYAGERRFQQTFASKINECKREPIQHVIFWHWRTVK